jgi:hypothetical protein
MFCGESFVQAIGIGDNHGAPKITRSSSSTSSKFLFVSSLHSLMGRTIEHLWIFRSSTRLRFQRVKNQVNRRFLQAGMTETPIVACLEIFGQQPKLEWNSHNSLIWTPIKMMSTSWKVNFINISIELYFGIYSVMYTGRIHEEEAAASRWEQESGDEDDSNKEKFGQCFH